LNQKNSDNRNSKHTKSFAIIGSGFSGLCLAIQLKKIGHDNFTIYEKAPSLGGTWRENTYPGAECDIPSALYSFSFESNPNWSRKWSEQPEILQYMEHCAQKYQILAHIKFNQNCTKLKFQEDKQNWLVTCSNEVTSTGEEKEYDIVVSGVGQLHKPATPDIDGAENFQGKQFHSAQWNHDLSLNGKTVNVIGNAASAVQFIPQIAPKVKQLNIFQRSSNWIVPKNDRKYFAIEKWLGRTFPFLTKIYRFYVWFMADFVLYQITNSIGANFIRYQAKQRAIEYIDENIGDKALQKKLTPNYPIGAKRVLFSDDFYQALNRNNVHLICEGIKKIKNNGVVTVNNKSVPCDVLIYATGFETSIFLTPMTVIGKQELVLNNLWAEQGAEAYLGITHTGFPNFFMMYGPNTNLGHNSIILMIEAQSRYILSCLDALEEHGAQCLDVKAEVQNEYNQWLQQRMQGKIWSEVDHSWYKTKDKVTNNWSGRTSEYRKLTKSMNTQDFEFS
jgi:cation diffusion facilitator CzcD-associated flavoprotein CzcO